MPAVCPIRLFVQSWRLELSANVLSESPASRLDLCHSRVFRTNSLLTVWDGFLVLDRYAGPYSAADVSSFSQHIQSLEDGLSISSLAVKNTKKLNFFYSPNPQKNQGLRQLAEALSPISPLNLVN